MRTHWRRLYREGERLHPVKIEFGDGRLDLVTEHEAREYECRPAAGGRACLVDGRRVRSGFVARRGDDLWLHLDGRMRIVRLQHQASAGSRAADPQTSDELRAPMTGTVRAIQVAPGGVVARGQTLLVVEAMKMEHAIKAPRDGQIAAIHCEVGDLVDLAQVLLRLAPVEH